MYIPFEGLLGNTAELRLINYLLPGMEFNLEQLSDGIEEDVTEIIEKFVEWDLVKTTIIDNLKYYQINSESQIIKDIKDLNDSIIAKIIEGDLPYGIYTLTYR